jgi:hypothetical protein
MIAIKRSGFAERDGLFAVCGWRIVFHSAR